MQTNKWSVTKLHTQTVDGFDGVVVQVDWLLTATDGDIVFNESKSEPIHYDPSASLIPFSQLTEQTVIGWLHQAMGERVKMFEDMAAANIAKKRSGAVQAALPWAQTE